MWGGSTIIFDLGVHSQTVLCLLFAPQKQCNEGGGGVVGPDRRNPISGSTNGVTHVSSNVDILCNQFHILISLEKVCETRKYAYIRQK
jgi:hypothetical protein